MSEPTTDKTTKQPVDVEMAPVSDDTAVDVTTSPRYVAPAPSGSDSLQDDPKTNDGEILAVGHLKHVPE